VPSYRELYAKADDELRKLKAAGGPISRLISHSTLVEASLNVLMKHDLLGEFSTEISRLESIIDKPSEPTP
jgi:hypothetical protein